MIHIWLPTQHAALRLWQQTTQTWQTADDWQTLATLANLQTTQSAKLQACLYFPSVNLLTIQPTLSASQLNALGDTGRRYLFEDISIGSVEDLQVKIQPTSTNSELPALFGLHAADIHSWINAASLAGIEIGALVPDFLLLPTIDTSIATGTNTRATETRVTPTTSAVYYQDADTQLLKLHTYHGMAVSFLPLVLTKLPMLETLYLTGFHDETVAQQLASMPNLSIESSELLPTPIKDPVRHFFNFATIKGKTTLAPYAKVIALVTVCALLTAFVVDALRWYYYNQAQKQASTLLAQQYAQWFPNEPLSSKLTLQRQLSSKLTTQQSATPNVLQTLSSIQPVLQQYQLTAKQLNFQNNHLQLQLLSSSADSLNKAVNDMVNKGIKAKLGSVDAAIPAAMSSNTASAVPSAVAPTSAGSALAMIDIELAE
ncbi:type II secretion system protein GspL [Moraxella sp. CTOTU49803]|uniref:type II secretion system protein GspL n=1 Tax=Moraxella sp. CTOTU49803 TaxID=2953840 RepID=UPI0028A93D5B|nr:type II secretion system protein GspL [Moraxella sp. CTOTU49803]